VTQDPDLDLPVPKRPAGWACTWCSDMGDCKAIPCPICGRPRGPVSAPPTKTKSAKQPGRKPGQKRPGKKPARKKR